VKRLHGSAGRSRSTHLRTKIVALLVSLAALWGFAAYVTMRAGLNLLWVSSLDQGVGRPTDGLITALQQERRLSLVYLGGGGGSERAGLTAARQATDAAARRLRDSTAASSVRWAATDEAERRITSVLSLVDQLAGTRSAVDAASTGRQVAASAYTTVIDEGFRIYDVLAAFDDQEIASEGRNLISLTRCRELLAREDALLSGVLAAGEFGPGEAEAFTQLVGAQRLRYDDDAARLPEPDRARYDQFVAGADMVRFRNLESIVMSDGRDATPAPVTAGQWRAALDPVLAGLRRLELNLADATVARARPAAEWVIIRLVLAGGLGLLAVIASIVVSVTTARSLVHQLGRLRTAALDLAGRRLPDVVERLRYGQEVDVRAEAPPLDFGQDEIGQVGQAFNTVQETAVRVAVEQAELRRGVREVFLSLARRSQALLHRQLSLLDAMERRAGDAEELAELFRVDHLATRMRRNAENLIVLSGAAPGRAWRKPVPLVDVVRGAIAEVEDYTRVSVAPIDEAALTGRAVGDVIHLLAELIENAASFSPPHTAVRVSASIVGNGYAIEIEDRGLGVPEPDRAALNHQLRYPPEFNLSSTARLGLFVVGRLAQRHGIRVQLTESPYAGTTAIVLIPTGLVLGMDGEALPREDGRQPLAIGATLLSQADAEAGDTVPIDGGSGGMDGQATAKHRRDWSASRRPVYLEQPDGSAFQWLPARPARRPSNHHPANTAPDKIGPAEAGSAEQIRTRVNPSGLPQRVRRRAPAGSASAAGPRAATGQVVATGAADPAGPADHPVTSGGSPDSALATGISPDQSTPDESTPDRSTPDESTPDGPGVDPAVPGRALADMRQMMAAYQRGAKRGRTDAERVTASPVDSPPPGVRPPTSTVDEPAPGPDLPEPAIQPDRTEPPQ
jgi:signal transduction histidine kinase